MNTPYSFIAFQWRRIQLPGRGTNAVDDGPKLFLETRLMPTTAFRVADILSEAEFKVRAVPYPDRGDMSNNDFIHTVLIVKVQLIHEHKHYNDTVETPGCITAAKGELSQSVYVSLDIVILQHV